MGSARHLHPFSATWRMAFNTSRLVRQGHGSGRLQTVEFGTYERPDGIDYTQPVPGVPGEALRAIIREKVRIETSVSSDTLVSYHGLGSRYADHRTLRHREGELHLHGAPSINGPEGVLDLCHCDPMASAPTTSCSASKRSSLGSTTASSSPKSLPSTCYTYYCPEPHETSDAHDSGAVDLRWTEPWIDRIDGSRFYGISSGGWPAGGEFLPGFVP